MTRRAVAETPVIIAHRGFAGAYPENTLYAVQQATTCDNVAMVEVDVMPTADGTVVCFHDDHLHPTTRSRGITDSRGTVWKTDTETVLNATVLESDEPIPRLSSILDAIPANVGINVELKNYGGTKSTFATALEPTECRDERRRWTPFVADVVDILNHFSGPVLVSSFYEGALAAVREKAPDLPIGVLVWDSLVDGLTIAARYDAEAVHPPWNLVQGTPFAGTKNHLDRSPEISVDIIEAAHEEGRAVNVWTVDTWYRAAHLARAGVDGLLVDYPSLVTPLPTLGNTR